MKKTVVYSCPFVPAEWIEAHGLSPRRIAPDCDCIKVGLIPGVCPYAHAFINEVTSNKATAVVLTTTCDQMRRAADVISCSSDVRVFLLNVPHTWQNPSAYRLYIEELKRLSGLLEGMGGSCPTNDALANVMRRYDDARYALRSSRAFLTPAHYSRLIGTFNQGELDAPALGRVVKPSGIPVALIGGPLPASSYGIFDFIENAGGYMALDGTETGERTLPAGFDRRRLRDEPFEVLAEAYFGSIPDPFRRPNSEFYVWLKQCIVDRGIRGIILRRYVWCDHWHAEAQRIREWAGLPFLQIDVGDEVGCSVRALSSLQAFMEMLR